VISLLFAITMTKYFRRLDVQQLQRERATRFVFYLFGMFGIAANVLQLTTLASSAHSGRSSPALRSRFITALFQFARMILLLPE